MRLLHGRRARRHHQRRRRLHARSGRAAVLAVLGPGLLAGLSDDDPAGITTYSIMGADHGYRLLWVLLASTVLLIVFHELAARLGVMTGKGLLALVRERHGERAALALLAPLLIANLGTLVAELAGVAAAASLAGIPRGPAVVAAAVVVCALVLGSGFHRVEHVLLALSAVFVAYVGAGLLAHPDAGATLDGLLVPGFGSRQGALLAAVACVGTTLAPWGLTFMQSYVADKRLRPSELRYERIDVATGAILTGVIGAFVIVACAATLHPLGRSIEDASDAALALEPLAGRMASLLFGGGLLGAALLAAAVVPLATAYAISEAAGHEGRLDDPPAQAKVFYASYAGALALAAAIVLVPAVPLVPVLFLTQALNAVLLLPILLVVRRLAGDPALVGDAALTRAGRAGTLAAAAAVAASVAVLAATML
ncbi:NRAMP family divalent metal transporter [Patulibacter defluvii]|uniref:NRAMP family divalent metal transporter n=1 Tax=Patulibacter defluvii TaxID=3095358 RepID=UPI002A7666CC|nr:divalent metal cation transporter [Patulibacter sp. DM4]